MFIHFTACLYGYGNAPRFKISVPKITNSKTGLYTCWTAWKSYKKEAMTFDLE